MPQDHGVDKSRVVNSVTILSSTIQIRVLDTTLSMPIVFKVTNRLDFTSPY